MSGNNGVSDKVREFFDGYPERRYTKKEIIVRAGEEPEGIMYLLEGRVSQYDISPGGTEVVVNVFKPRAFFPVSWAINRTPNRYFFEAATDVVLKRAPADDVVAFLKREPDVLFDLLSRVYIGSDGLLRRLAHLMGGDARSRLLFEILNSAYRFGEQTGGGPVRVPLTESDLARHSGLARETVNRAIQSLKAAGLVDVKSNGLVVLDVNRLEAELGSDL